MITFTNQFVEVSMCLEKPIEKNELSHVARKNLEAKVGYKIYRKRRNVIDHAFMYGATYPRHSSFCGVKCEKIKRNRWMIDKKRKRLMFVDVLTTNWMQYPTGYHIYLTKTAARETKRMFSRHLCTDELLIFKVKFTDDKTLGIQKIDSLLCLNRREELYKFPCIVARKIIIKELVN